ncbi:MAG: hypothetical protein IK058_05285 [Bacteroidales bacterium]|nr:hypothetical protein [Bacteroidales bacterium]
MKKSFSRWMWHFDRIFGDNKKIGWQILIILGLVALLVALIGLIGWLLLSLGFHRDDPADSVVIQSIGLAFGASNLPPGDGQTFPLWWQALAVLLGAVLFSGVTITFVGNLLNNRQESYRNGTVRYWFEDHLLFLGGSRIILPMLKVVADDKELCKRHVVVLTSDDVERLRTDIERTLPSGQYKGMKITVLSGDHYDKDTLESVHAGLARRLYIVGDHLAGSEHDSENVACWDAVKELCAGRKPAVPCLLFFSRASSAHLFRRRQDNMVSVNLDTTVIHWLESVAQRVLVHNGTEDNLYPALDRDGIGPDSERTVHLVLGGMTSVSYAVAVTAAHLCHFPNSVDAGTFGVIPSRRTKITFVAPHIKAEMDNMTSHLASLFNLSHYTYVSRDGETAHRPDARYGDFLDVEWEFIDGSMAEGWVIDRLKGYYKACVEEEKTYLTLAFCDMEADRNIAAASYLPYEFHKIVRHGDTVDYRKTIPLLLYQPYNEKLLRDVRVAAPMYENIFPFGSLEESYDPSIRRRISEGKRINYIYNQGESYRSMPSGETTLDEKWHLSYLDQVSNIYSANHIGVKLRSMGGDIAASQVELMAAVEHNRWNMEKLLVGYEAVEESRRRRLKQYELSDDTAALGKEMEELNRLKRNEYIHHCIAPYAELLESKKLYDRLIVKNLKDV